MSDSDNDSRENSKISSIESKTSIKENKFYKAENHYQIILEKLQQQRNNEDFCDVVLIVESIRFPAHRNVLSAFSDYFYKMFTTDMKEKQLKEISIENVTAVAMEIIMTSMYSGKLSLSEQVIADVLQAASLMQATVVLKAAKAFLVDAVEPQNCCFFRSLANRYVFDQVFNQINDFILQKFDDETIQADFLNFKFEDLSQFLSSDELTVNEEKNVFEFILKWVEKDIDCRKVHFPSLFKHVRLQFIPIKFVVDVIAKNNLVREFHECRDLVENAFSFYITPKISEASKQRKCFASNPDSILLLSFNQQLQQFFDLEKNQSEEILFEGFSKKTVLPGCGVANDFPMIALCGGISDNQTISNQVVRYDGFRWMNMPNMNDCRCGAAAVFFDDDLYVFGGEKIFVSRHKNYSHNQVNPDASSFVEGYDKFSNENWVKYCQTGQYRARSYSAAVTMNRMVYLIGGYCLSDANDEFATNSIPCKFSSKFTLRFSPAEDKWDSLARLKQARAECSAAVLNEHIFVVGGYGDNNSPIDSTEMFSRAEMLWTVVRINIVRRRNFNANSSFLSKTVCVNGTIYLHYEGKFYSFQQENEMWKEIECSSHAADITLAL